MSPHRESPDPQHRRPGEEDRIVTTTLSSPIGTLVLSDDDVPCRENDADLWFADTPAGVEFAKALCGSCPVRAACLDGALARREPWGVWGGELFELGVVIPRKRPRGRPRKVAPAA
jgi:WhiB family redox-sensing transcriptional regulator